MIEVRTDSVVVNKAAFHDTLNELEKLRTQNVLNMKKLWLLGETDQDFAIEMSKKLNEFDMSQLKALFDVYSDMRGRLSTMRATVAEDELWDREVDMKEGLRELIFKKRKDGRAVGRIKSLDN